MLSDCCHFLSGLCVLVLDMSSDLEVCLGAVGIQGRLSQAKYNSQKSDRMPDIVLERSRNSVDISFLENKGLLKYGWISSF